jgi:transposase
VGHEEVSRLSKRYTPEFRTEAIRQVTERTYPVREAAGRLGVSTYFLYKWLKGMDKTPRLAGQEDLRAESARLKTELKRVEEERDVVIKATGYFARHLKGLERDSQGIPAEDGTMENPIPQGAPQGINP